MNVSDLQPGTMVELLGHPWRTPLRTKVGKSWKDIGPTWRPAVFAHHDYPDLLVFRWTDSRQFHRISQTNFATLVRAPRNGTASQERYLRDWGELC